MANWIYNGVELPALPDWDKETYPYACILQTDDSAQIMLIVLSLPYQFSTIRADFEGNGTVETRSILCSYAPPNTSGQSRGYLPYNGAWYSVGTEHWDGGSSGLYYGLTGFSNTPVWSNVDIINTDSGNVYFHTSSPIRLESKLSIRIGQMMSYNGTILPPLPAGNPAGYSYAMITKPEADNLPPRGCTHLLYYFDRKLIADETGRGTLGLLKASVGQVYGNVYGGTTWEYLGEVELIGGFTTTNGPIIWSDQDILNSSDSSLYLAASEPILDADAIYAAFMCSNLNSTDSVYKIAAWCYPKGTHYLDAPFIYVSTKTFAGTEHGECSRLAGLTPGVEYELYACILVDNVATDHNALVTFTTNGVEELDFSNATLIVSAEQVLYNHYIFALDYAGLPYRSDGRPEIFDIVGWTDAGDRAVMGSRQSSGSGTVYGTFANLEPLTDYTATFEVYYNGQPTGVTATVSFTTEEEYKRKGYDRDSFLLGLASGLGATAATKTDAEHNSWMQGYIVGSALAAAIRGSAGDDTFDGIQSADGYTLLDSNGVYLIPTEG